MGDVERCVEEDFTFELAELLGAEGDDLGVRVLLLHGDFEPRIHEGAVGLYLGFFEGRGFVDAAGLGGEPGALVGFSREGDDVSSGLLGLEFLDLLVQFVFGVEAFEGAGFLLVVLPGLGFHVVPMFA